MEKYLASSAVQISAAAFLAIFIGIVVGQIAQRGPIRASDETVASDNSPLPGESPTGQANMNIAATTVPPGPVSGSLPSEPDAASRAANWPNSDRTGIVPSPGMAIPGGKFANIVPDKAPRRPRPEKAPPAEKPAYSSTDQTILHVRQLQTQLMVGALSCGQPRITANYNSFVTKFDRVLKANGNALKAYFTRMFGARGVSEMDSFMTKLSNEISLVSMRNSDFCNRTDSLLDSVLAIGPAEVEAFADHYLTQPMVARDGF